MKRYVLSASLVIAIFAMNPAEASDQRSPEIRAYSPIAEAAPTLAPFQHVRFCLRYPDECKAGSDTNSKVDATAENIDLLKRVNHSVNNSIAPRAKVYGSNLEDRWTIDPASGDCNDYAVTKRHELVENGIPANALRLSVTMTPSGIGHLVLVVSMTNADVVLDNLTEVIRPWQETDYRWLKIQSAADPRYWKEISPVPNQRISQAKRRVHTARRVDLAEFERPDLSE